MADPYGGARLSFVLPAPRHKRPVAKPPLAAERGAQDESFVAGSFVSSFSAEEPTLAEAQRAPPKVIPLAPNTNLIGVEPARGAEAQEEDAASALPAPAPAAVAPADGAAAEAVEEDDDAAAAAALLAEVGSGAVPLSIFARAGGGAPARAEATPSSAIERPSDALDIAYDQMPVEDFGSAMLRGMGWSEGLGVGRNLNAPNQPVEYVARHHRLGLGAQPKAEEPGAKKKPARIGESREARGDLVYVDAEGRQRHVKPVGEKLTARGPTGLQKGAAVTIAHGPHAGLDGTIVSVGGLDGQKKAGVRLQLNGETVLAPLEHLAPASAPTPAAPPAPRDAPPPARDGERKRERDDREHGSARRQEGERVGHRGEVSHRGADGGQVAKRRHAEPEPPARPRDKVWVVASIRVRVVDQRAHSGALYNKKGVVVDTGGSGEFALLMDGEGGADAGARARLREGITQRMVETALPKPGGSILVVRGELRGRRGRLLERDSRRERAVVQMNGDFAVATLGFDDVSEWAGHADEAEDDEY